MYLLDREFELAPLSRQLIAVVTRAEVRALLAHAAQHRDERGPGMTGVCFDFARGEVVATDGHRMALCYGLPSTTMKFANPSRVIVDRTVLEAAIRSKVVTHVVLAALPEEGPAAFSLMMGKRSTVPESEIAKADLWDERPAPLPSGSYVVEWQAFRPVEHFPPYVGVIPKLQPVAKRKLDAVCGFDTRLVADVDLVRAALDDQRGLRADQLRHVGLRTTARLSYAGAAKPLRLDFEAPSVAARWVVAVMPKLL